MDMAPSSDASAARFSQFASSPSSSSSSPVRSITSTLRFDFRFALIVRFDFEWLFGSTGLHASSLFFLHVLPLPLRFATSSFACPKRKPATFEYFQDLAKWMNSEDNQREFFHLMATMDVAKFCPRHGLTSTPLKLQMQLNNRTAMPIRHLISLVIDQEEDDEYKFDGPLVDWDNVCMPMTTTSGVYRCLFNTTSSMHQVFASALDREHPTLNSASPRRVPHRIAV
jgi:hypothetical protein